MKRGGVGQTRAVGHVWTCPCLDLELSYALTANFACVWSASFPGLGEHEQRIPPESV